MSEDEEYTRRYEEKVGPLRLLLTPEFLATLTEAARTCGWAHDYDAIVDFVMWCHEEAGMPCTPGIRSAYDYSVSGTEDA